MTTEHAELAKRRQERVAAIHRAATRMREQGRMPLRVQCGCCGGAQPDVELCVECGATGTTPIYRR